ncbi:MAG: aminotransferase class III-fold pyridoxal phosphate-dependent enzyme [Polyangiaceae bacterium]
MKALAREQVIALDKAHVWHPYTAIDEYIAETNPQVIARASGSRRFDADGRAYLDGNSSWWCAALGHNRPRLVRALRAQAERFSHTALAGLALDEVFPGYGRTGPMWAGDHAGIAPDILCTAKGFTGGLMPMSATLATRPISRGPAARRLLAANGQRRLHHSAAEHCGFGPR